MKKKHWKREIRWIYLMILKDKRIVNINKAIGYYDLYNRAASAVKNDPDCPDAIKNGFVHTSGLPMPKYLKWAEKYTLGDKDEKSR